MNTKHTKADVAELRRKVLAALGRLRTQTNAVHDEVADNAGLSAIQLLNILVKAGEAQGRLQAVLDTLPARPSQELFNR